MAKKVTRPRIQPKKPRRRSDAVPSRRDLINPIKTGRQLNSLLQAMPDMVYFKDTKGHNCIVNKAYSEFVGKKIKDIIGRTDAELLPPGMAKKCLMSDKKVFKQGKTLRFEECSLDAGGKIIVFDTIKVPFFDDTGKIIGLVGISRNIMERKTWEQRLQESEERFRSLFENSTLGLYRTTPEGQILLANPALVKMLGYASFPRLTGRNLSKNGFEPSNPRSHFVRRIEKEGEIKGFEAAWKKRDGSIIFVRESARAVRGADGKVAFYEGTVEDITERKLAEQDIAESEKRFRAIFETAQEIIFLKDSLRKYKLINPAMEKALGRPAKEIVGLTDAEIFGPNYAARIRQIDQRVLAGKTVAAEIECPTKKGLITFFETNVPIRNQTGKITGICGIAHDVTERKSMEEALRHSLQEKETLLKEIHHRVKNNMQIISSILNLQAKNIDDPGVIEIFNESQSRIRSMALIHDKLYRSKDFSRIDFSEYLRSLISSLFQSFRTNAALIKLKLETHKIDLDINTAIPCGLIVNELIFNALKHAFPESRGGEIRVQLSQLSKHLFRLVIFDNGIGFPEGLDFRNTETLGMQLVMLLVGQLDGTIVLDRKHGTQFTIVFKEQKAMVRL